MKQLKNDLSELANLSSRNDKLALLKDLKERAHHETISLLKFLYNPRLITGISTKKLNKGIKFTEKTKYSSILELLDYLIENNTGRDVDILEVVNFQNSNSAESDFIEKIVTKTFKAGVTAKTLNQVYGKSFIPTMELQLAESYDKFSSKLSDDEYLFVTIKYDGHRAISELKEGKSYARSGLPITGLKEIEKELKDLSIIAELNGIEILDGEFLIEKTDKPKEQWFNETTKVLKKDSDKTNIQYIVFDGLCKKEFYEEKESLSPYALRRQKLETIFNSIETKHVKLAPLLYHGRDKYIIMNLYENAIADGEEGIMVNLNAPYYCKRTKTLLKVKPTKSADLEIVGFEKGNKGGKNEHTLGAILVNFNGRVVNVGSGFSDTDRDEIWNNKDQYLGKIAEINYTSVSTNKDDDSISLRFPRFKTIRDDKTVDDVNIE